jgi:hypothetical protein
MSLECPYCTMESMEPIDGPTEVYFDSLVGIASNELNMINWRAYRCETCGRVVIVDEDSVN